MKKIAYLFLTAFFAISCSDGDLIITSFNLEDQQLMRCGEFESLVFYQIQGTPAESISVKISTNDSIFNLAGTNDFILNGTTNVANYRNYDSPVTATYFCNNLPPSTPIVITEYVASSGIARITNFIILNDNDTLDEAISTIDTDSDGIPDYYDFDDDGDNVPTASEIGPDPLNPRDTDGDDIPDYLDNDDDGDGIFTIYEDANMNLNPVDDSTNGDGIPDYLNSAIAIAQDITTFREHSYTSQTNITLNLVNALLIGNGEEILEENIDMGEIINTQTRDILVTPTFTPPALRSEIYKPQ